MQRQHWLLSILSGVLLLAGLHPSPWPWISCLGFLPLFLILFDDSCNSLRLGACGLATGLIYYGIGLSWIIYYDPRVYFLAVAACLLFLVLYFPILRFLMANRSDFIKILGAVFLWILFHKIYALSPIGPAVTEFPFYTSLPFFQPASLTGFILFPALVIGLSASAALFTRTHSKSAAFGISLFLLALISVFIWGKFELKKSYPVSHHWAVIQHNLPVSGKWRLKHLDYIRTRYRELALKAAEGNPSMIIFPLYTFPDDILRKPEFFTALAKETNAWILVATYIPQKADEPLTRGYFYTALLYSPEGKLADYYQAVQGPPFRKIPEHNQKEYKTLSSPFGKLGILLCYEDCLPAIAHEAVQKGAEILIAISNPGQFTSTWMPYYHFIQDRLRAIESERYLVRASANGYSGVVDPKGRFIQKSRLNQEKILQINVGRIQSEPRSKLCSNLLLLVAILFCAWLLLRSDKNADCPKCRPRDLR